MAVSKHPPLRYNILDYCFRNKYFTFNEILRFLNEKIAMLYPRKDIKVFRDENEILSALLVHNIRILKYTDQDFSIVQKSL